MEINPQAISTPESQNSLNEHIFTYTLSWGPNQYRRGQIKIITCYDDTIQTGWTSEGYATATFQGKGHHKIEYINERWYYDNRFGWGWYYDSNSDIERKFFVDNQEIYIGSYLGFEMGTIGKQLFRLIDFICDSGFVKMEIKPRDWAECEINGWFPTDPIDLKIIEGAEYASFVSTQTGIEIGTSVFVDHFVNIEDLRFSFGPSWEQDGLENIAIMPKDSNFTIPFKVKVEASINEVTFTNEFYFEPRAIYINADTYSNDITTGEQSTIYINVSSLCLPFPNEEKINVQIIKGQKYGNLINPYTGEYVKEITNLDHWWGNAWIDYFANSTITDKIDTVIIRISTPDINIPEEEVEIYIKPPPIYVYTIPEVIGQGDTAEVKIKKRNDDGSLEGFPQEQIFELALLEGCVNGNILVGDSLGVYFSESELPIYFVAADSLESDSGIVRLRVGTEREEGGLASRSVNDVREKDLVVDESSLSEIKTKYFQMIEEARAEFNKTSGETRNKIERGAPITEVCYYGDYIYKTGFWEGDVVVKNDEWCEDLDECDEIEFPDIELEVHENEWNGLNVCPAGFLVGTTFLPSDSSNYIEDFDIELCKEEGSDKIQFTFDDDIVINCVSDMCEDYIREGQDILINDVYSFPQSTSCQDKIFWLDLHKRYPYPTKIVTPSQTYEAVYVIRDIWMRHEAVHRDHFLKVAEGYKAKYLIKIKETIKQCSNFSSKEDAQLDFKIAAKKIIKQFYDEVKNEDDRISSGGDDNGDIIKFENDKIHKKVIDDYLQPLIDRWRLQNCVD